MPSGAYIKRYNFETVTELLNEIKNRHMEMIENARKSILKSNNKKVSDRLI